MEAAYVPHDAHFFFSAPLIAGPHEACGYISMANYKQRLANVFERTNRSLRVRFEVATRDAFMSYLHSQCPVLHFTGHGINSVLAFEDSTAKMSHTSHDDLRKQLQTYGQSLSVKLAFLSACHSETVAPAFLDAGVPHVVAVKSERRVTDDAAHCFMETFFVHLFNGASVQRSFNMAKLSLEQNERLSREERANQFVLLPHRASHEECLFADRSVGTVTDDTPPLPRNNHHTPPEYFVGRQVEMQQAMQWLVTGSRLVTITGQRGIGKTATALSLCDYLTERRVFPRGIYYFPLSELPATDDFEDYLAQRLPWPAGAEEAKEAEGGSSARARLHRLKNVKCMLVLDGLEREHPHFAMLIEFASLVLMHTRGPKLLITSTEPLGEVACGHAQKVINIPPLTKAEAALLLVKVLPRSLQGRELGNDRSIASVRDHPVIEASRGVPLMLRQLASLLTSKPLGELAAHAPHLWEQLHTPREYTRSSLFRSRSTVGKEVAAAAAGAKEAAGAGAADAAVEAATVRPPRRTLSVPVASAVMDPGSACARAESSGLRDTERDGFGSPAPRCRPPAASADAGAGMQYEACDPVATQHASAEPTPASDAGAESRSGGVLGVRRSDSDQDVALMFNTQRLSAVLEHKSPFVCAVMADQLARRLWARGGCSDSVRWSDAMLHSRLARVFSESVRSTLAHDRPLSDDDMEFLRDMVTVDGDLMRLERFAEFWKWLEGAVEMIKFMAREWRVQRPCALVAGMMNRETAAAALRGKPVGAFVVRITSRWRHTLVISFVDERNRAQHIVVSFAPGTGFAPVNLSSDMERRASPSRAPPRSARQREYPTLAALLANAAALQLVAPKCVPKEEVLRQVARSG